MLPYRRHRRRLQRRRYEACGCLSPILLTAWICFSFQIDNRHEKDRAEEEGHCQKGNSDHCQENYRHEEKGKVYSFLLAFHLTLSWRIIFLGNYIKESNHNHEESNHKGMLPSRELQISRLTHSQRRHQPRKRLRQRKPSEQLRKRLQPKRHQPKRQPPRSSESLLVVGFSLLCCMGNVLL